MSTTIKPNITIEMSGVSCPGPILSAKRLSDELQDGQILLLVSDCSGTHNDLIAWCKHTRHQLLKVEELGDNRRGYFIRKGDPWPANVVLDVIGSRCPGPVIEAARLLNGMAKGEVIKLISNCESAGADVKSWASATGHELLGVAEAGEGVSAFFIRK